MSAAELPAPAAGQAVKTRGFWRQALRRLARQPVTLAATALLVAILVAGELAPVVASKGWNDINLAGRWRNHPPTLAAGHLLGTDQIGRDTLQLLLWGIHYSEQTAVVGGLAATLLALAAGLAAGYHGGWTDATLMRIADLVTGFPVLVLLIVAFTYFRPVTVWKATAIFTLAMWPFAARVFRARTAALSSQEFVDAARALGASNARIILRHLAPNAAGAIIVSATTLIGQIVLIEATAEFFGFGVQTTTRPTLGNLIGGATESGIGANNTLGLGWWTWTTPAVALILLLACLNLVGDGLDTALNPRN